MPSQTPALNWEAPALQAELEGCLRQAQRDGLGLRLNGVRVRVMASTGSTNTDLLDWARRHPDASEPVQVLLAESQTAGRGRLGRSWKAVPGASLTFSMALPMRPQAGWGGLSLVVGHAVAQALQPWSIQGPVKPASGWLMLKWPNDLWWVEAHPSEPQVPVPAQGRKLAGILIETLPMAERAGFEGSRWVVVGVGVNIRPEALTPEGLPPGGVAGTAMGLSVDAAPAVWHRVMAPLLQALLAFESRGFADLRAAVERRDLLVGQSVSLSAGPVPVGRCLGIDPDGALRVLGPDGPFRVVAGEVQVRPMSPASK